MEENLAEWCFAKIKEFINSQLIIIESQSDNLLYLE